VENVIAGGNRPMTNSLFNDATHGEICLFWWLPRILPPASNYKAISNFSEEQSCL
jgi:hypothetical protein